MAKACFLLTSIVLAAAPAVAGTYGDRLVAQTMRRHPEIAGIAISAQSSKGIVRAEAGSPASGPAIALPNAMGEPIGTVAIAFRTAGDAATIAREMGRMIYTADTIGEADPFVPGTARSVPAQRIVDAVAFSHSDLVTLAMHVALPGRDNQIIASNFGRIGKAADKDDAHVIADGAILKEVTNGGKRVAIELPMQDAQGRTIGALSTSFTVNNPGGGDAAEQEAITVRDEIARQIPGLDALNQ